MDTFNPNIEKWAEKMGYAVATHIDANMAIVVKPRPWWMPNFIYKSIVRGTVSIVKDSEIVTYSYKPDL